MRRLLSRAKTAAVAALILATTPALAEETQQFPVSSIPTVMGSFGQAYSPDRQLLYHVSSYNAIAVIDVQANRFLRAIDLNDSGAILSSGMGIAKDKLFIESYRKIIVVDLATERVTRVIDQPFYLGSTYGDVVVSPNEDRVYTIIGSTSHITVINPSTEAVIGRIEMGPDYNDLALSPSGDRLYATNKETSRLAMIDTADLSVERIIPIATGTNFLDFPSLMTVSNDGTLYVSYVERDYRSFLAVFQPDGTRVGTHPLSGFSTGVAVSPGGDYLVTGGGDILSSQDGSLITHLPINPNGLSHVFFPPGDHRAFVTNKNSRFVNVVGGFAPPLSFDGDANPSAGQSLALRLNLPEDAQGHYVLCASMTANRGVLLPSGRRFPIDVDSLFRRSRNPSNDEFSGFSGVLGTTGMAIANLTLSPDLLSAMGNASRIYFAFATFSEGEISTETVRSISNVIAVDIAR